MISKMTPLGAVLRGIAAGALGTLAIGAYLKSTAKIAPKPAEGAFVPPEEKQKSEEPTHTVARRLVEDFMHAGPLADEDKEKLGNLVHLGFGAGWGALYGIVHGSHRALRTPLAALAFGTVVWGISDNVILPAFHLAPPPTKMPAKMHLYMWLAHLVYGGTVYAAFEGMRSKTWMPILAPIATRWAVRNVPSFAKPAAYRVLETVAERRPARRLRDAAAALASMA